MLLAVLNFVVVNMCLKFLSHLPAFELVLFRALLTLVITFTILKAKKINPWGNNKKLLILRGLFGSIALTLFFYTLQHLPLGTAVTLQYMSPIFTLIVARVWLKEKPQSIQWFFFSVAFIGVYFTRGFGDDVPYGVMGLGLISAFFSGCAYTVIRKLRVTDGPMVVVFYFPLVTVPLIAPMALMYWVTPQGRDWLLILCIGVFTQIAQIYLTKAFQTAQVHEVSIAQYIGVVLSLLVGFFVFSEAMGPINILGIVLIMLSVGFNAQWSRKKRAL